MVILVYENNKKNIDRILQLTPITVKVVLSCYNNHFLGLAKSR